MKMQFKKRMACAVAAAACAALLAGCSASKDEIQEAGFFPADTNIRQGAQISRYVDEQGNQGYSYVNPDGSGGGGMEIA